MNDELGSLDAWITPLAIGIQHNPQRTSLDFSSLRALFRRATQSTIGGNTQCPRELNHIICLSRVSAMHDTTMAVESHPTGQLVDETVGASVDKIGNWPASFQRNHDERTAQWPAWRMVIE